MFKLPVPISLMLLFSSLSFATPLSLEQTIPSVSVSDQGQLISKNQTIEYKPWDTKALTGKTHIIQAMAGRTSAKEMNAPLIEAIKAAKFPQDKYQTLTIINQDDALWGTGSFVKSSAEDSKKEFPHSSFVLDAKGEVAKAWQLQEKSSAIIVVDASGNVKFAKEGALKESEIKHVIKLVTNMTR